VILRAPSPPADRAAIAEDVARGLTALPKSLPPYLFYDAIGSMLYERITELPEYYLTRAEREILEVNAAFIVARAAERVKGPLSVVELGAGSASKTEVLLRALAHRQDGCLYVPIDVSQAAIDHAERRLHAELPDVCVRPMVMRHDQALSRLREVEPPTLALLIGSSIGNFEDGEASALLRGLRDALGAGASLVLGTDLRKSADVLLPAYDDAAGVTAAFNKNLLVRINRELGGSFDLDRFEHVARWNDRASRIEMHLESTVRQEVSIPPLDLHVSFEAGETIHTESSIKYSLPRVERLLTAGGFRLDSTFYDGLRRFAVHLAFAV
jgi:dimethylhistidine N-methyltransferase